MWALGFLALLLGACDSRTAPGARGEVPLDAETVDAQASDAQAEPTVETFVSELHGYSATYETSWTLEVYDSERLVFTKDEDTVGLEVVATQVDSAQVWLDAQEWPSGPLDAEERETPAGRAYLSVSGTKTAYFVEAGLLFVLDNGIGRVRGQVPDADIEGFIDGISMPVGE